MWVTSAAVALLLSPARVRPALPQDSTQISILREIQESRQRLEQIRAERERLQSEMGSIQLQAQTVSGELSNIERQISASRSVVAEIDFQVEANTRWSDETAAELLRTRAQLDEVRGALNARLRDIYKRGPLHAVRVLLGADSFGDLLMRYRYLRLIAGQDRALVDRVAELERALVEQADELREGLAELDRLRDQKNTELGTLQSIEADRRRTLDSYRTREGETMSRLDALQEDEARLRGLVANLESSRIAAGGVPEAGDGIPDEMRGALPWPLDGQILYRFGPREGPGGTALSWSGLGIGARRGAPVRAVRGGIVALAGPFEGYGPTVVISHGAGFYTLYLYLEEVGVVEGRSVTTGQVVGTLGGTDTPEGPHIELQIRVPGPDGTPVAVDPMEWLAGGRP